MTDAIETLSNETGTTGKLPRGSKRVLGVVHDAKSLKEHFVTRVIMLPVIKPLRVEDTGDTISWADYGKAINAAWAEAARIGNLAIRSYALSDPPPAPGAKLKKWNPGNDVYHACRDLCPQFDTNSLSQLLQTVQGVYKKTRFEILVRQARSLPSFTHGLPIPLKAGRWDENGQHINGAWSASTDSANSLLLSHRLGSRKAEGIRCQRMTVMLGSGRKHRRHAAIYRRIISREIEARDAKLISGGSTGVMVAITVIMPRSPKADGPALQLRTDAQSLLVWRFGDAAEDRPPLHFDQIKQLIAGHHAQQQRWSDDLKFEKRWPGRKRRRMLQRRGRRADRWARSLRTAIQQSCACIAGICKRNRISRVEFDSTDRTFALSFPWHQLEHQLAAVLELNNVELVAVKTAAESAPAGPEGDQGSHGDQTIEPVPAITIAKASRREPPQGI